MQLCQTCSSINLVRIEKSCLYHYECQYNITIRGDKFWSEHLDPKLGVGDQWIDFTFCTNCGQIQGNWGVNSEN